MISKEKFIEIIDKLRKVNDFAKEINNNVKELGDCIEEDFTDANLLIISHESIVVELLEDMFGGTDLLEWWLWELDYGRKYKRGCIKDGNGKNINISTVEKLYDYLVKKREEK